MQSIVLSDVNLRGLFVCIKTINNQQSNDKGEFEFRVKV